MGKEIETESQKSKALSQGSLKLQEEKWELEYLLENAKDKMRKIDDEVKQLRHLLRNT